jgi:hypothetical protein
MDINHLTAKELEALGNAIHDRISQIRREEKDDLKRKDSVKNKTKLSQLSSSDRIFKIQIFENANTEEMNLVINYVKVGGVTKLLQDGYDYNFGGSSSWFSNVVGEKHYHLDSGFGKHSFTFYTLKPETWVEDLNEAREYMIQKRIEAFERELTNLKKSLSKFDGLKDQINLEVKSYIQS